MQYQRLLKQFGGGRILKKTEVKYYVYWIVADRFGSKIK